MKHLGVGTKASAHQRASRSDRTGRSGQIRACLRANPMTRQFSINLGRLPQSSSEEETRVVD